MGKLTKAGNSDSAGDLPPVTARPLNQRLPNSLTRASGADAILQLRYARQPKQAVCSPVQARTGVYFCLRVIMSQEQSQ